MPYYLCSVVGTGAEDDPHRPYISKYLVNWIVVMDGNQPEKRGCLVYCSNPTPEIDADPEITRINIEDNLEKHLSKKDFNHLKNSIAKHGLSVSKDVTENTHSVKQLITTIGKGIFNGFDIDNFFVL